MDKAVKLYCDTLGFELKEHSPEWSVIATKLGELGTLTDPWGNMLELHDHRKP